MRGRGGRTGGGGAAGRPLGEAAWAAGVATAAPNRSRRHSNNRPWQQQGLVFCSSCPAQVGHTHRGVSVGDSPNGAAVRSSCRLRQGLIYCVEIRAAPPRTEQSPTRWLQSHLSSYKKRVAYDQDDWSIYATCAHAQIATRAEHLPGMATHKPGTFLMTSSMQDGAWRGTTHSRDDGMVSAVRCRSGYNRKYVDLGIELHSNLRLMTQLTARSTALTVVLA